MAIINVDKHFCLHRLYESITSMFIKVPLSCPYAKKFSWLYIIIPLKINIIKGGNFYGNSNKKRHERYSAKT